MLSASKQVSNPTGSLWTQLTYTIILPQADDDEHVSVAAADLLEGLYAPGGVAERELRLHFERVQAGE